MKVEEMVASLRSHEDDPGFTRDEIGKAAGLKRSATGEAIRKKLASGEWVQGRAHRLDSLGRPQRVPVYREAKP